MSVHKQGPQKTGSPHFVGVIGNHGSRVGNTVSSHNLFNFLLGGQHIFYRDIDYNVVSRNIDRTLYVACSIVFSGTGIYNDNSFFTYVSR